MQYLDIFGEITWLVGSESIPVNRLIFHLTKRNASFDRIGWTRSTSLAEFNWTTNKTGEISGYPFLRLRNQAKWCCYCPALNLAICD